jgi:hypothetical protein
MDLPTVATVVTAFAAAVISYLLQKPYVRVVKMFNAGIADPTVYKLKNAGAATAICVVLQDALGQPIDLDLKLGQLVRYVDALPAGAEIKIEVPNGNLPVRVHYENLFGLLFHTDLADAGNRFRMVARKTWPFTNGVPPNAVFSELPSHWWRRRG